MGIFDFLSGGVSSIVDSVGKVIDSLSTTDEEKIILKNQLENELNSFKLNLLDRQNEYEKQITERLKLDMTSDSWLSKNIRPMTLIFILIMYSLFSISSGIDFEVNEKYVELLGQWGMLIMSFYFGGRTVEKIINVVKDKNKN